MVEVKIGKNVYVASLTWTYLANDDRYKRLSNVKKDGIEAGGLLGLGLHPKLPQSQKDSGFGYVLASSANRKWIGKRSLAAVVASRVLNGIAFFPVDETASQMAIILVLNGIPLVDVVTDTDRIDIAINEIISDHLSENESDTFSEIQRPLLLLDENLSKASESSNLGYAVSQLSAAAKDKRFEISKDEIFSDLAFSRLPKGTKIRLLKGFEPIFYISLLSIFFLVGGLLVVWKVYQDRIEQELRESRLAAQLVNRASNDGPTREELLEQALNDLEIQVGDSAYSYFVVNSANQYPLNWPIRVVEAVQSLPRTIAGFEVYALRCSTIQGECLLQFRNLGQRSSLIELEQYVGNSDLLSGLRVDSNRTEASASIRFNRGTARISIDSYRALPDFTASALQLSDEVFSEYVYAEKFAYGTTVDATFEQPVSSEITANPDQSISVLVESSVLPTEWVVHQRIVFVGPNTLTMGRAIDAINVQGFGVTELDVTFDGAQDVTGWQMMGRLIRSGTAQTNKVLN